MKKKKIYVLMLSRLFPASHPKAGERTYFRTNLLAALDPTKIVWEYLKLHTIRANYELWKKRIEEVQRGEAILSIRQWTGKPYRSKQVEIVRLTYKDGIGIQKLDLELADKMFGIYHPRINNGKGISSVEELANNDGLSLEDWKEWFKNYDLTKPLAIIHFTPFRY